MVDTVTNVADYTLGEARFYGCAVRASFRYWRWTVTVGTGYSPPYGAAAALELYDGLTWGAVDGMAFMRAAPSTPVLMSRDGGVLNSTGTALPAGSLAPVNGFGCLQMAGAGLPTQGFGNIKEVIFVPYGHGERAAED